MNQKEIVPIVFVTSRLYLSLTKVAIASLVRNTSPENIYEIYILHTELSQEDEGILLDLVQENINIHYLNVTEKVKSYVEKGLFFQRVYITVETYYRLFMTELLPQFDKIIYLDGDVIVKTDIKELYDYDLGTNLVAASRILYDTDRSQLGLMDVKNTYFNSGVMLINGKLWREEKVLEQCLNVIKITPKEYFRSSEQDVLNMVTND